jgi:uncharacterized phage protein gp47/JayE
MAASLTSLVTPLTAADARRNLFGLLQLVGFPVASWAPSSVPRALVEIAAESIADLSSTVSKIAQSGFLSFAEGEWLTLLADEFFGVGRKPAVFARGIAVLADSGSAGPFTVLPGQLWATSKSGRRFTNAAGGTLALGGKLSLHWKAEGSGASYNVAAGDLAVLLTPLPGVTVSNPPLPGVGTWLVEQGVDGETDEALRQRCREKWSSLGAGGNAPAYAFHAKSASPQVTRVKVYEATPTGGQVTLVLAGPAGALADPTVVPAVAAYLEDGRRPQCVKVNVKSATNRLITLLGEVRVRATLKDPAMAFVAGQLVELQGALDIGDPVAVAELVQRVMDAPGVLNAKLTSPLGVPLIPTVDDVLLGPDEVATFANALVWIAA